MQLPPDTGPLHTPGFSGGARVLEQHAQALRARGASLAAAAAQVRWFSSAATCFRRDVELVAADFRRAADSVEHAAATLRAHTRAVAQVEAAGTALLRTASGGIAAASGGIAHGIADAGSALTSLVS